MTDLQLQNIKKEYKQIKAVFFDLDGTLLNTIDDLTDAMNAVLDKHGYPLCTVDECKCCVGEGAYEFARSALPREARNPRIIIEVITEYRMEYAKNWNRKTEPYSGIIALLNNLNINGIKIAILSNKRDEVTKETVSYFLPDIPFTEVYGARTEFPLKPDPASALYIAEKLQINPKDICFVGDTKTDMQTATAAGMTAIGVLWGFRTDIELRNNGAKYLVNNPMEIIDILSEINNK